MAAICSYYILVWVIAMKTNQRGFTLIELLITIAVLGILVSFGVPSMAKMIQNNSIRQVTNELVRDINLARSAAVDIGQPVGVCKRKDSTSCQADNAQAQVNWHSSGWLVFADPNNTGEPTEANIIREALPTDKATIGLEEIAGSTTLASFFLQPDGTVSSQANARTAIEINVNPLTSGLSSRKISVSSRGNVRASIM